MAKRFTDTRKWRKAWFRMLSPKMKCAWAYLCDNCDGAGIWDIDMDAMSFDVGDKISLVDLHETFDVVEMPGDKLFIVGFIPFQYKNLNPKNRAHFGIMNKIIEMTEGLPLGDEALTLVKKFKTLIRPPIEGQLTPQEKEEEKEKEKEKEEKVLEPKNLNQSAPSKFEAAMRFDFQALFSLYPRFQKKSLSLSLMAEQIKTQENYDRLERAIKRYRDHCQKEAVELKHMLTFPNFLDEWEDWLDEKTGKATISPIAKQQADGPKPVNYGSAEKTQAMLAEQEAQRGPRTMTPEKIRALTEQAMKKVP